MGRGLGWELKMPGGSKLRLPKDIRWSKRNFFVTKKLINNLSSIGSE